MAIVVSAFRAGYTCSRRDMADTIHLVLEIMFTWSLRHLEIHAASVGA